MKIMFILFEGFDTANGTNHLVLKIMETLLDSGIAVHLVSSHTVALFDDIPISLRNREGFDFTIVNRKIVKKKNFIERYLDGIRYAYNASKEWRKIKDIDGVILQSTHTAFFSALFLNRYLKKPIVYNSYDVFPDGPYLFGAIQNKIVFKILSAMQNYIYKNSRYIIVISEDMKNTFKKKNIPEEKLHVIPNWYDANHVKEVGKENQFIKKYGTHTEKFIVQYAGNFGYTFNYQAIIEIARYLKYEPDIEFHMIGTGGFEKDFKKATDEAGLKNIRFFPWQSTEMVSDVYSACNIEIIPLSKGVIWTSFPSKCALLMACRRTFICLVEKESDFYRKINDNEIGICIDRENYEEAAKTILKLFQDYMYLEKMQEKAYEYGQKYYSSKGNVSKYVKIINEL